MSLRLFADRLAALAEPPVDPALFDLRVADTAGAYLTGRHTAEAEALRAAFDLDSWRARIGCVAAIVRHTELDDIDLRTVVTPSAAVVPAALGVAARTEASPERLALALFAGYAAMLRHGRAIGGDAALARGVWPALLSAPIAAAAAAAVALELPAERIASALRLALARAGGRAGKSPRRLPARWFLFGDAVVAGISAALAAANGLTADEDLDALAGDGAAAFAEPLEAADAGALSHKPFCTARQVANAVAAFADLVARTKLAAAQIARVEVALPTACVRLATQPLDPSSRLSTLSNAGFQIAAAACDPDLLNDVERRGPFVPELLAFASNVQVAASADLDALYPERWAARVALVTRQGERIESERVVLAGDDDGIDAAWLATKYPALDPAVFARRDQIVNFRIEETVED